MTLPDTLFENNARAAHAVNLFLVETTAEIREFSTRPFNRFDTAFTEWWMIPSSDWPAYRYGKLCFWRYPNASDGLMYVGYNVEKGLHPDASAVPEVDPKQIMRGDWYWSTFESEVDSGGFVEAADHIGDSLGTYPRVLIQAHEFNKVPKEDQPRADPSDVIEFGLGPGGDVIALVRSAETALAELNTCTSLKSAIKSLSQLDLRFHWIDLIVGLPFRYGGASPQSWSAARLWKDAFQPWTPWVR